jgi:hypothetical protein
LRALERLNSLVATAKTLSVSFTMVMRPVVIRHWPAMVMSQAVVRVHIVVMVVHRLMRGWRPGCLGKRRSEHKSRRDQRRNK